MLTVKHLHIKVPDKNLIKNLTFKLRAGECWALLGPNGCGKTSLLKTLAHLRPPEGGEVLFNDQLLSTLKRPLIARNLSLLLQDSSLDFWGTVFEYVVLGRYPHHQVATSRNTDQERTMTVLSQLGLDHRCNQLFRTLSGGERQRARIAQLLVQDPLCYLLDEPLQHLDLRHQLQIMSLFSELAHQHGKIVLIALHEPQLAFKYCDHALLLYDDGIVKQGSVNNLLTISNLELLYQCDLSPFLDAAKFLFSGNQKQRRSDVSMPSESMSLS